MSKRTASEEGHSLVEAIVALALLLTVLAPLAALATRLGLDPRNRHLAEALVLAQAHLEVTLRHGPMAAEAAPSADGPWRVEREVVQNSSTVTVTVRVSRHGHSLVELSTLRLR